MKILKRKRDLVVGATFVALIVALGMGQSLVRDTAVAQAQSGVDAPMFEVDPLWPQPLPNHWVLGTTIGVAVDSRDHVFIVHRPDSVSAGEAPAANGNADECCEPAPPVLEFDPEGNFVNGWGGPGNGYEWFESNHGLAFDQNGNIWIGGNGANDAHILQFTRNGRFLKQVGRSGMNNGSLDTENFWRVAKVFVDPLENEVYVADGYGNKRVAVIDAETGEFKRFWGAYGNEPDDADLGRYDPSAPPAQQFRNPVHCAELSVDRLLYVCDRVNDRIQVFQPDGTFVDEIFIEKNTLGAGSVWEIAFSRDQWQTYMYVADGVNERVHIIDRQNLDILTSFGDGGRQPGQFYGVHSIATDSRGNIFTTETFEGKRLQKFVYKGIGNMPRGHQGVVWPSN
jgi:DNA-binding beta-propeller fold protein YncE